MPEERDIFISFTHKDKKIVGDIVEEISSRGASCWFQLNDSSQDYAHNIMKAIKGSGAFVVFLSHASIMSEFVKVEITSAFNKRVKKKEYKILPIFLDDCRNDDEYEDIDMLLCRFNALNINDFDTIDMLVDKILDQLDIKLGESADSIYSAQAEEETKRLAIQNEFYNRYASTYIAEAFQQISDACVLDVGCSDGTNTVCRFKHEKYSMILGVDFDKNKVEKANSMYGTDNIEFRCADITDDSFEQVLMDYLASKNRKCFDFIHVSAVFLHIKTHEFTLKILYKYLSPTGYLFVVDEDDGLNLVHPSSKFYEDCFYIWNKSLESGDRSMGRKLPLLMKNAGFQNITIKRTTISSIDFGGEMKEVLWDLYFNPHFWVTDTPDYFSDSRAFDKIAPYTAEHDENKRKYMNGEVFIMLGVVFILAQKG